MTTSENQIARLEERMNHLEIWKETCFLLPTTVAEVLQWRKDLNGHIKTMADDMQTLMRDYHERRGQRKLITTVTGILGFGGMLWIVTQLMELFR